MANEELRIWGIHTTDDSLFLHDNVVAIGWKEFGDCSKLEATREAYKNHYIKSYPDGKKGAVATSAGMLYRFVHEMKIGDHVVYPSKSDRKINIGVVESDFIYNPTAALYVQQRKVKWLKHLPRTAFSQGALYELSMIFTTCPVPSTLMDCNYRPQFRRPSRIVVLLMKRTVLSASLHWPRMRICKSNGDIF